MDAQHRRRIARSVALTTAAAVFTTGALAGCSTPAEPEGPVDLRMAVFSANETQHEVMNAIADAYIAENGDKVASIEFEALTGGDYITALTTQIAGGDSPDLAWVFESNAPEFVKSGVLADVSGAFETAEGYEIDDLIPAAMKAWEKDGNYYAYPFSSSPFGILVNLDLIAAAGQPNPRDLIASGDWTWDALMDISAGVVASNPNVAGFSPGGDPYKQWNDTLPPMWAGWGAQPWDESGTECGFTSPEMTDFLSWFHEQAFDRGTITKPGQVFDFLAGQAAGRIAQMSLTTRLDNSFAWDFLPLPAGPAGEAHMIGQAAVGVVARGENPEIAADFLAFFTNPENAEQLAQFFPPPRESLLTVEVLTTAAPQLTPEQAEGTVIAQAQDATVKAGHVNMSGITDRVRAALDALWTPAGDVTATTAAVCEAIAPFLTED